MREVKALFARSSGLRCATSGDAGTPSTCSTKVVDLQVQASGRKFSGPKIDLLLRTLFFDLCGGLDADRYARRCVGGESAQPPSESDPIRVPGAPRSPDFPRWSLWFRRVPVAEGTVDTYADPDARRELATAVLHRALPTAARLLHLKEITCVSAATPVRLKQPMRTWINVRGVRPRARAVRAGNSSPPGCLNVENSSACTDSYARPVGVLIQLKGLRNRPYTSPQTQRPQVTQLRRACPFRKVDEVQSYRLNDCNGSVCRPELPHRVLEVEINSVFADLQNHPNVPRRFARGGPFETIFFPRR
jgi:hypothetical protein